MKGLFLMKKNKQAISQYYGADLMQGEVHDSKRPFRLTSLHVIMKPLALVLVTIMGLCSLGLATNVYAVSECGLLFSCPDPTPEPTPEPTPRPAPTPKPTPPPVATPPSAPTTRPTPAPEPGSTPEPTVASGPILSSTPASDGTPLPALSPTATVKASPTPTSTTEAARGQMPDTTSNGLVNGTPISRVNVKNQAPAQLQGSDFLDKILLAVAILLCVFLALGIGLFFFHRMLLPPLKFKAPSAAALSWMPSPRWLSDKEDTKEV